MSSSFLKGPRWDLVVVKLEQVVVVVVVLVVAKDPGDEGGDGRPGGGVGQVPRAPGDVHVRVPERLLAADLVFVQASHLHHEGRRELVSPGGPAAGGVVTLQH